LARQVVVGQVEASWRKKDITLIAIVAWLDKIETKSFADFFLLRRKFFRVDERLGFGWSSVPSAVYQLSSMAVTQPYHRNRRPFINGSFLGPNNAHWRYIYHPKYAELPDHYFRGFNLILKDLINLFDYIEPSDINFNTYSFRINELLFRTCVEIEANLTAILRENGYSRSGNWAMDKDYYKIEASHHLSAFEVLFPVWYGGQSPRVPFADWAAKYNPLFWYKTYNTVKHDRLQEFTNANFKNLTYAVAGLVAVIAAQFGSENYFPGPVNFVASTGPNDGMDDSIADYFRIKYPANWTVHELYDFDWQAIQSQLDPFADYTY
jgi:hypothetical protein